MSAFNMVVRWHKLGEMQSECTSHKFIVFAILVPNKKFSQLAGMWQSSDENNSAQFVLRHGVVVVVELYYPAHCRRGNVMYALQSLQTHTNSRMFALWSRHKQSVVNHFGERKHLHQGINHVPQTLSLQTPFSNIMNRLHCAKYPVIKINCPCTQLCTICYILKTPPAPYCDLQRPLLPIEN